MGRRRAMSRARKIKQRPVRLVGSAGKRDVRTQFGALCWRERGGKIQVLLVTSRRTRRWILPKGWPQDGATPAEAAAAEAWEEAGAIGRAMPVCLGIYSYLKDLDGEDALPCVVAVFPVKVKKLEKDWPEAALRKRRWASRSKAAAMVEEPELKRLIAGFDPAALGR